MTVTRLLGAALRVRVQALLGSRPRSLPRSAGRLEAQTSDAQDTCSAGCSTCLPTRRLRPLQIPHHEPLAWAAPG